MNIPKLKQICKSLGVGVGGNKVDLIERIRARLDKQPSRVLLGIDIGYKNLGYITVKTDGKGIKIANWGLIDPGMPNEYNVKNWSINCQKVLGKILDPTVDTVIIERQSWRVSRSVPTSILRNTAFEAMLFSHLIHSNNQLTLESIQPQVIAKHLNFGNLSYNQKKKRAIEEAANILKTVECSDKLLQDFMSDDKKDDMADCLLLVKSYIDWDRFATKFDRSLL